jgi:hypothetical protein
LDALKLISKVSIQELDSVDFMLLGLQVSTLVQLDHLSHQHVEDLTVFLKASLMVTAALLLLALVLRGNLISQRRVLVTADQGFVELGTSDGTQEHLQIPASFVHFHYQDASRVGDRGQSAEHISRVVLPQMILMRCVSLYI